MSTVTFKCTFQSGQKSLQWTRQVNGSILQLSLDTRINETLPEELYTRLKVKVEYFDDFIGVYYLEIRNVTKIDEGVYLCTDKRQEEEVIYTLYIIREYSV